MEALVGLLQKLIDLFRWFVIVNPWERGLRIRLGRAVTRLDPGVHWRVPIVHQTFVQSIRLRIANCSTQTVQTSDGKVLTVGATLEYQIEDVQKLYETLHHAEDTLTNLVMQAVATSTQKHTSADLTPQMLAEEANKEIQFGRYGLKRGTGIRITDFVFARTYRLITDTRDAGYGKALDTESRQQQSSGTADA